VIGWGRWPGARRSCCRVAMRGRRSTPIPSPHLHSTTKTLLQMAVVLTYGASLRWSSGPDRRQYAKPDRPLWTRSGCVLRGDMINAIEATLEARTPDPTRMVRAYTPPPQRRGRDGTCCARSPTAGWPTCMRA